MAFRIPRQQGQLARQVLDIVHDKGDAAVEFIEPRGFHQCLLAGLFGEVTGQLLPDHTQEIEVLPVEAAWLGRAGQDDHPCQPVEVKQRNNSPGFAIIEQPLRQQGTLAMLVAACPQIVRIDDEGAFFKQLRKRGRHRLCRHIDILPAPACGKLEVALLAAQQQQTVGTVGDIGHRLDHAFVQRLSGLVILADGLGKPQPFGPIVITVLEQVLDCGDLEPSAQPLRRQPQQGNNTGGECETNLRQSPDIAAKHCQRLGDADHQDDICPYDNQRERLECHGTRWPDTHRGRTPGRTDSQWDRCQRNNQPAHRFELQRERAPEIGHGIDIEVERPQCSHRRSGPAQDLTHRLGRADIEVVQQDKRANRNQYAKHRHQLEDEQFKFGRQGEADGNPEQCELQQFDKAQRIDNRPDRLHAFMASIVREQAIDHDNPRDVAQDFHSGGGDCHRPPRSMDHTPGGGDSKRRQQRPSIGPVAVAALEHPRDGNAARRRAAKVKREGEQQPDVGNALHQRAPSGHNTTRSVCSRISRSRKGV